MRRKKKLHIYTDEEVSWLKSHRKDCTAEELTAAFNDKFGADVTVSSINAVCSKNGITKEAPYKIEAKKNGHRKKKVPHSYTDEEISWIRDNRQGTTSKKLAVLFNERFHTDVDGTSINNLCKKYGIVKDKDHTGETKEICGHKAVIVRYNGCRDVEVKFDGYDLTARCTYGDFQRGRLNKQFLAVSRTGEVKMIQGHRAVIERYDDSHNILVRFDGYDTPVKTTYTSFKNGQVGLPDGHNAASIKPGDTVKTRSGLTAVCTAYRDASHVDVVFPDGVKATVSAEAFKNGSIGYKDENSLNLRKRSEYTGMRKQMRDGTWLTVAEYRNSHDVTLKDDNGNEFVTVMSKFKNGTAKRPDKTPHVEPGERYRSANGLTLLVISYDGMDDVTAVFEDGTRIKSSSKAIRNGAVLHPAFKKFANGRYLDFELHGKAFATHTDTYYYCRKTDSDSSQLDIMTAYQMMESSGIDMAF